MSCPKPPLGAIAAAQKLSRSATTGDGLGDVRNRRRDRPVVNLALRVRDRPAKVRDPWKGFDVWRLIASPGDPVATASPTW